MLTPVVTLTGLSDMAAKLKEIINELPAIGEAVAWDASLIVLEAARRYTPVGRTDGQFADKHPGLLKAALHRWKRQFDAGERTVVKVGWNRSDFPDDWYATFFEYGHDLGRLTFNAAGVDTRRHIAPGEALWMAYEETKDEAEDMMAVSFKEKVESKWNDSPNQLANRRQASHGGY